jgi:hypothetical protein
VLGLGDLDREDRGAAVLLPERVDGGPEVVREDVVAEQHEHLRAARERLGEPDRLGQATRLLLQRDSLVARALRTRTSGTTSAIRGRPGLTSAADWRRRRARVRCAEVVCPRTVLVRSARGHPVSGDRW